MTSVSGMAKTSKNIMQSDLGLDTLQHVIISIHKLCSFLQFRHILAGPLCVATRPGLSLASSTITGYNIPSNDMSKNWLGANTSIYC